MIPAGTLTGVAPSRETLSRALNRVFSRGLSLRVADMSSAMRMYRAAALPRILNVKLGASAFPS